MLRVIQYTQTHVKHNALNKNKKIVNMTHRMLITLIASVRGGGGMHHGSSYEMNIDYRYDVLFLK